MPSFQDVASDHSPPTATANTGNYESAGALTPPQKQHLTSERKSHRRRVPKAETMRVHVAKLEQFALIVRVLSDADAVWDEFLDDDTKRLRGTLRGLDTAMREAEQLVLERAQIQRLLTEYELARRAIVRHVEGFKDADNQSVRAQRWRLLAKEYFRPISMDQCLETIQAAVSAMERFEARADKISTGMTFMGWRDTRLPLSKVSRLEFRFDKTYAGFDVDFHVKMMRQIYNDAETYRGISLGRRARVSMNVLQKLSRTACVVHFTKSFPGIPLTTHHLYLLACLETEYGGAIQFVQPIEDDAFQRVVATATDVWTTSSYWIRWQILDSTKPRSSSDYRVCIGGSMRVEDPTYLTRWLFELLGVVVRSEVITTGRFLLTF